MFPQTFRLLYVGVSVFLRLCSTYEFLANNDRSCDCFAPIIIMHCIKEKIGHKWLDTSYATIRRKIRKELHFV
uniref:Putative secreted peptide n=1 Tax=Anopheles braziliensis TaxID=58242 RepID=A0A2M3ZRP6_9DIPT